MPLPIFRETLRRSIASTLYWGLAFAAMAYVTVVIMPNSEMLNNFAEFMGGLPKILLRMTGVGEDLTFLATPEGFIAVAFFGKMLLFFVAYSLAAGLDISAREEDSGALAVLLSLPLPRWRVITEKFAAYSVTTVAILLLLYGGVALGVASASVPLELAPVQLTVFNLLPTMLYIMGLTTLVGAYAAKTRATLLILGAYIILSFLLETVGAMGIGTLAENLRYLSFFRYSDSTGVMQHGLVWSNILVFMVLALALMLAATRALGRRDLQLA